MELPRRCVARGRGLRGRRAGPSRSCSGTRATRPLDHAWVEAYRRRRAARSAARAPAPTSRSSRPAAARPHAVQAEALEALERTRREGNPRGPRGAGHRPGQDLARRLRQQPARSSAGSSSSPTARRSWTRPWTPSAASAPTPTSAATPAPRRSRTPTSCSPRSRPWAECSTCDVFDPRRVRLHRRRRVPSRRGRDLPAAARPLHAQVPARPDGDARADRRRRPAGALPGEPGLPLRPAEGIARGPALPVPLLRRPRRGRLPQHPVAEQPLRRGGADRGGGDDRRARERPRAVPQARRPADAGLLLLAAPRRLHGRLLPRRRACGPSPSTPARQRAAGGLAGALEAGDLDVVCAVDMFNEGVDLPHVDTVMMLRPTESRVVWLQQFGRGLRQAEGRTTSRSSTTSATTAPSCSRSGRLLQLGPGDATWRPRCGWTRSGANRITLPPGCEVTYDLGAIDMLARLLRVARRRRRARRGLLRGLPRAARPAAHGRRGRSTTATTRARCGRPTAPGCGSSTPWATWATGSERVLELAADFLDALEVTPMTRSFKMLVLLAMLDRDALPGGSRSTPWPRPWPSSPAGRPDSGPRSRSAATRPTGCPATWRRTRSAPGPRGGAPAAGASSLRGGAVPSAFSVPDDPQAGLPGPRARAGRLAAGRVPAASGAGRGPTGPVHVPGEPLRRPPDPLPPRPQAAAGVPEGWTGVYADGSLEPARTS